MTEADLRSLYEKLYFHEVESRESINSRLQTPLTILVAIIGVVAFLLQNYEYESFVLNAPHVLFAFFVSLSVFCLGCATYYFSRSWYDNEYHFLPASSVTADYRRKLVETYSEFENGEELVEKYLGEYIYRSYIDYAAWNTNVNDARSAYIHRCNGAIIVTVILLFCGFLGFYFGGLDKNKLKKAQEVTLTKPIDVRVQR
jgi:hypothetical protein